MALSTGNRSEAQLRTAVAIMKRPCSLRRLEEHQTNGGHSFKLLNLYYFLSERLKDYIDSYCS
ncbi:MAG: hypothetical protein LBF67_03570 [Prevotellaceae bacterium]|nr:hypothetical protein [Prevotellaceae bacterium]